MISNISFAQNVELIIMPSDPQSFPIGSGLKVKACNPKNDTDIFVYVFFNDHARDSSQGFKFYQNLVLDKYSNQPGFTFIPYCFESVCPNEYAAHTICDKKIGVLSKDELGTISFFLDTNNSYWKKFIQSPMYVLSQKFFFYTKYIDIGKKTPSSFVLTDNVSSIMSFLDFVIAEKIKKNYPDIKNNYSMDSANLANLTTDRDESYGYVGIKLPFFNQAKFRSGKGEDVNQAPNSVTSTDESYGGIYSIYYLLPEFRGRERKHEVEVGLFWFSNSTVSAMHISNTNFRGFHAGYTYRINSENQKNEFKSRDFNGYIGLGGFLQLGNFDQSIHYGQSYSFSQKFYKDFGFSPALGFEYNKRQKNNMPSRFNFALEARYNIGLLSTDQSSETQYRTGLFSVGFRTDYKISKL